jgi:hypothetical protein
MYFVESLNSFVFSDFSRLAAEVSEISIGKLVGRGKPRNAILRASYLSLDRRNSDRFEERIAQAGDG